PSECPAKYEPVEAAENPENPLDMACYKSLHGVPPEGRVDLGNIGPSYFTSDAVSTSARLPLACSVSSVPLWRRSFLVAASPRCVSVASVGTLSQRYAEEVDHGGQVEGGPHLDGAAGGGGRDREPDRPGLRDPLHRGWRRLAVRLQVSGARADDRR